MLAGDEIGLNDCFQFAVFPVYIIEAEWLGDCLSGAEDHVEGWNG